MSRLCPLNRASLPEEAALGAVAEADTERGAFGGGERTRDSGTSASVESGSDGASSGPEFESAKEAAKKRARAGDSKAGGERRSGRPGKPRGGAAVGLRRPGRGKRFQVPGRNKSAPDGRMVSVGDARSRV